MGEGRLRFRHIPRGGEYLRVADPDWPDPLDGSYAREHGGRWNPPGSFPVVYLSRDLETARANVRLRFAGQPFTLDDLRADRRPVLVYTGVVAAAYVDVVTDGGCAAAGLPASYPHDADGDLIPHATCQPIGQRAWDHAEPGIACRSAAPEAPSGGEELAWFSRERRLVPTSTEPFDRWFWPQA